MQLRKYLRVATPTLIIASLLVSVIVPLVFSSKVNTASGEGDETTYYLLSDHLGSIDVVLDETSNVVERRDYLPYGSKRLSESQPSTTETDHKFTGKELDNETGLHYYGARYYDAEIGRFVSIDPWEGELKSPQTLNKFTYTINNPVRFVDPTGEKVSEYQPATKAGSSFAYGDAMGQYRGVEINSAANLTGTGSHPYQCTTLAKEFASSEFDVDLSYTGHGYAYGEQDSISRAFNSNNPDNAGMYAVNSNGGLMMPQEDDIISWSGGPYGHVGFIAEVVFDDEAGTGQVYTIEQNISAKTGFFVQDLTRGYNEQGQAEYTVESRIGGYEVSGWAHYDNQSRLSDVFNPSYTTIQHSPATKPPED